MTPVLVVVPAPRWFPPFGVDVGHPVVAMEPLRDLGLLCWVDESPSPSSMWLAWCVESLLTGPLVSFDCSTYPALRAGSWSVST